jgi:hypothetical protein
MLLASALVKDGHRATTQPCCPVVESERLLAQRRPPLAQCGVATRRGHRIANSHEIPQCGALAPKSRAAVQPKSPRLRRTRGAGLLRQAPFYTRLLKCKRYFMHIIMIFRDISVNRYRECFSAGATYYQQKGWAQESPAPRSAASKGTNRGCPPARPCGRNQ